MRSFISRAALLVKVTARIWPGQALPVARIWASRVVSTRVLPVPAPAKHEERAVGRLDRRALLGIEALQIGRLGERHGAGRHPAAAGRQLRARIVKIR